jgi:hypothetical protein
LRCEGPADLDAWARATRVAWEAECVDGLIHPADGLGTEVDAYHVSNGERTLLPVDGRTAAPPSSASSAATEAIPPAALGAPTTQTQERDRLTRSERPQGSVRLAALSTWSTSSLLLLLFFVFDGFAVGVGYWILVLDAAR